MKVFQRNKMRRGIVAAILLTVIMIIGGVILPAISGNNLQVVHAAETTIHSMEYYSANDGPVLTASGVGEASYGFVMPIFNGGEATWKDVAADLSVKVKDGGTYKDIDSVDRFVYNQNWGHWNDGGFTGYWFKVSETTELQLYSKANGVSLDYRLEFTNVNKTTIQSMTATDGPELTAGPTGSVGFTYPTFNGDSSIPYAAVADDLKISVKTLNSSAWVNIDNNAASGWIYDQNFGQFTDGPGGYWFTLTESINVKLESKSSGASLIYTLNYAKAARNSFKITAYDDKTTYEADESGAIGIPLPKIDGNPAYQEDLENFVYEIKINGNWIELGDFSKSTFVYSGNGYNKMSDKNQWGYWVDYIYGLWFQPIQQDYELRIGYPENGKKGGAINNNYVNYKFIGNPNALRPEMPDDDFTLGNPNNPNLDGWDLVFNDEFSGNKLDTGTWNYVTGYYINDDPGTWGWGNNELEHYTDSEKNVYVANGNLNLAAYDEPKSFPQDPNRVAPYSSGKITSEGKFSFKYGRIDFRAKLPTGNGLWPALWLLPDDDTYGTWAASGEIDVMEARGRIPGASSGAIHFGGTWPANTYLDGGYVFPEGQTIDSDYHMYSLVWEEDMLKWYVDGNLFFFANSDQWYTTASNAKGAPFDKEFYIIMNLAVGGWFDGGITPNPGDIPATMQVDYVRVYKAKGDTKATSSGSKGAGGETGTTTGNNDNNDNNTTKPSEENNNQNTSVTDQVGNAQTGLTRKDGSVEFYVNGATFADVHYKVNGGAQINVAMKNAGNGNFTYTVDGLKNGDKIEYFFTYNPGNGALDTEWATYELKEQSGNTGSAASGNTTNNSGNNAGTVASGKGVTLYTDSNFGGASATFGVGEYNMADMQNAGIANDTVSSIKVPLGYKLTVFWDIDFGGNAQVYSEDSAFVGAIWDNQITSFIVEEASYYIENQHSGMVLDIEGGNKDNGANLIQYTRNGGQNQQWKVAEAENGYAKITSVLHGKAIDVADLSKENGANIHIWEYVNGDNQKWQIRAVGDGYYNIVNKLSGLSMDNDGWSTKAGANIIQWALGNKQANQLWKFELVNADPAKPVGKKTDNNNAGNSNNSGNTGNNNSNTGNNSQGSQSVTNYADKPELRKDIAAKDGQMFFQFNNKTNGKYKSDQIYWCILGFHPETGKLCYVDKNGNLVPANASLNTISKGDRKCANVFYTLADKDYVYMPDIVSGRMYISYGSPVYVTINEDANGNVGFAGPDLNNPSDPNQDVLFEFVEFTIKNGEYWGNTTRVDFYSFPVVSRLVGDGGFVSTPGDADHYDRTVGDIGTRDEIFKAFKNEVPAEFQTLVQELRIMAPCKATFNEGEKYANYFDAYINQIWDTYRDKDLVFTCQAGTFKGRTKGNQLIFSKDGGASDIVVNKPTTQDALEGKGTLAAGTDIEKVVEAQLCAAINRGIALNPDKWADASAFYKSSPANFYAGFFHNHSVDGLAYGFCYDDVFDYSTLLHYTKPTALVIDLKW